MKSGLKRAIVLLGLILVVTFLVSCHTNSNNKETNVEIDSEKNSDIFSQNQALSDRADNLESHSANLHSSYIIVSSEEFTPELSPLYNEINALGELLIPYLDPENSYYVGIENADFIKDSLLYPDNVNDPIVLDDWAKLIQLLFKLENSHDYIINQYSSTMTTEKNIERQYAISVLMELLSQRYPLSLEKEQAEVDTSNIISDIDSVNQKERNLILKAHYLGFTDYTLDENNLFRPEDSLSKSEAISILCRILNNFGYPVLKTSSDSNEHFSDEQSQEAYSFENIFNECNLWVNNLNNSKSNKSIQKLEIYKKAEEIIYAQNSATLHDHIPLDNWLKLLQLSMGVDISKINSSAFEKGSILTFDIAAISIFSCQELYSRLENITVTDKVINKVHDSISQIDTSSDTEKFAKMFASGLIDGLYQVPGFTPQRPVNKAEALLLVKRIIEKL